MLSAKLTVPESVLDTAINVPRITEIRGCATLYEMLIEGKDSEMESDDIDFSALPPHMVPGVQILSLAELIRCVSNGTEELRYYLLKESNTIIECKVCFNLFRNVGYFIAHKRFYCLACNRDKPTNSSATPPTYDEQSVTVAPELPTDATDFKKQSVELVRNNLLKRPSTLLHCYGSKRESFWQIYNKTNKQNESNKEISSSSSISFEPIDNTKVAMKVVSSDVTEENDINSAEAKNQEEIAEITPDIEDEDLDDKLDKGTTSEPTSERSSPIPNETSDFKDLESNIKYELADFKHLKCLKCQRIMSSKKSLVNHVINLHGDLKRYYSCPLCKEKLKFRYFWGVIRHLSTIHYMKKLQINKIRSTLRKSSWVEKNSGEIVSAPILCKTKPASIQTNNKSKKATEDKIRLKNEEIAFANDLLQQKVLQGILSNSSKGRKKFRCQSCKKVFTQIKSLQAHLRDCTDWEHVTKSSSDFKQNGQSAKKSQVASKSHSEPAPSEELKKKETVSSNKATTLLPKRNDSEKSLTQKTNDGTSDLKTKESIKTSVQTDIQPCPSGLIPLQSASIIPQLPLPARLPANMSNWTNPPLGKFISIGNNTCTTNKANSSLISSLTITPNAVPLSDQSKSVPCIVRPLQTNTLSTVSVNDLPILLPTTALSGSVTPAVSSQSSTNIVCSVAAPNTLCLVDNKQSQKPSPVIMSTVNKINPGDNSQIINDNVVPNILAAVDKKGQISLATILLPANSQLPVTQLPNASVEKQNSTLIPSQSNATVSNENKTLNHLVENKNSNVVSNGHVSSYSNDTITQSAEIQPLDDVKTLIVTKENIIQGQKVSESKTLDVDGDDFENFAAAKDKEDKFPVCKKERDSNITNSVSDGIKPSTVSSSNVSCQSDVNSQLTHQESDSKCSTSPDITTVSDTSQDLSSSPENHCSEANSQHLSKKTSSVPGHQIQRNGLKYNSAGIRDKKSALHSLIDSESLRCIQCTRSFSKMSHVRRHAIRHLGWKRYKCKFCSFSNYERSECKTHIKRRHLGKIAGLTVKLLDFYIVDLNNNDNQITSCDSKFFVKRKEVESLKLASSSTTNLKTSSDDDSEEYTRVDSPEHMTSVSDCSDHKTGDLDSTDNDTSVSNSTDHAISVSEETSSANIKTGEKQDSEKILALIDTKSLKCLECSREFQKRSHLRRHIVRHLGLKRYKCKQCKFTSYDRSECRSHIERCHLGKVQGITVNSINCSIVMLGQSEETYEESQMEKSNAKETGIEQEIETSEDIDSNSCSNFMSNTTTTATTTTSTFTMSSTSFNSLFSTSESSKTKVNKKPLNIAAGHKGKSPSKQTSGKVTGSAKRKKSLGQVTSSKRQISPKKAKKVSSTQSSATTAKKLPADDLSVLNTRKGYYVKPNFLQLARSAKKIPKSKNN
ncbi:serine-rich adhesin for platelets-like [Octopus vulgaris]|uniref:Serine-rich adhesin for platelets-like n=2 Tax=Octopus vulgaris TaxID=6645 RepID=A0AA36AQB6_OCTVU|nr:serine-rich adhesin for platelets-like [Octopus vulgaris]